MDKIESFMVSHAEQLAEADTLREWEAEIAMNAVKERVCVSINVYNGVPVVPMGLVTKESKSIIANLRSKVSDKIYSLHRLIVVAYVPSVLNGTAGTLSMKLYNRATGESIDMTKGHPVSQAATFVSRWPRAVLAKADALTLLISTSDVPTRTGSLIGTMHPFWEDKLSSKMVYEKQLPSLTYLLEEQDPAHYIKNVTMLRTLMASKVLTGGSGSDLGQQTISLGPTGKLIEPAPAPKPVPEQPAQQIAVSAPLVVLPGPSKPKPVGAKAGPGGWQPRG